MTYGHRILKAICQEQQGMRDFPAIKSAQNPTSQDMLLGGGADNTRRWVNKAPTLGKAGAKPAEMPSRAKMLCAGSESNENLSVIEPKGLEVTLSDAPQTTEEGQRGSLRVYIPPGEDERWDMSPMSDSGKPLHQMAGSLTKVGEISKDGQDRSQGEMEKLTPLRLPPLAFIPLRVEITDALRHNDSSIKSCNQSHSIAHKDQEG
ncbi:uncharacterized protein EV420DRAFT_1653939 [Desarmillaria tabescens]|uniref:Uncharacterized protein n=1 Tax=Armillaria tabescens TaxID=1929756 RepID=A0AA39MI31_ARMTA|nr:uncharacterized protein EV420DRAFT_1653939 [Desarmillaria tabescens]KAK0434524.1 hypothetical protein EV420DRAFT_1653939 [Desarmillaria tabescens]